jgi:hypothetical protein
MNQDQELPAPPTDFTIIKGNPTDEELAAVIAVLSAQLAVPASAEPGPSLSPWATYWREAKNPPHPGPGAWQAAVRTW